MTFNNRFLFYSLWTNVLDGVLDGVLNTHYETIKIGHSTRRYSQANFRQLHWQFL